MMACDNNHTFLLLNSRQPDNHSNGNNAATKRKHYVKRLYRRLTFTGFTSGSDAKGNGTKGGASTEVDPLPVVYDPPPPGNGLPTITTTGKSRTKGGVRTRRRATNATADHRDGAPSTKSVSDLSVLPPTLPASVTTDVTRDWVSKSQPSLVSKVEKRFLAPIKEEEHTSLDLDVPPLMCSIPLYKAMLNGGTTRNSVESIPPTVRMMNGSATDIVTVENNNILTLLDRYNGRNGLFHRGSLIDKDYSTSGIASSEDESVATTTTTNAAGPHHPSAPSVTARTGDSRRAQTKEKRKSIDFDEEDIVYGDHGVILGGSVRALVKRLIPRRDYCPDRPFVFAFLLNARVFVSPADLLQQMLQHCMFEQNAAAENFKKESRTRLFLNILRVCREWADAFPYDFRAEAQRRRLRELFGLCSVDRLSQQHADEVLEALNEKLEKLDRYEKALAEIGSQISFAITPSDTFSGLASMTDSPRGIAQQLTHIELERLSMIGPEEFVYTLSKDIKPDNEGIKIATKNIQHYVDWFNRLTFLVASDIVRNLKKRHRVRTIEFFIDVAKECFNLGNFNSLMAIVAGLSLAPVARLEKSWAKIEMSKLKILQHQLDPSGNFMSYRSTLKAAIWRAEGAKNPVEKIVIPFFTLLVKDIALLHSKCSKKFPNGHINYAMCVQFSHHIREFMRWKRVECSFERNARLLGYLLTSPIFTEKGIARSLMLVLPMILNHDMQVYNWRHLSARRPSSARRRTSIED